MKILMTIDARKHSSIHSFSQLQREGNRLNQLEELAERQEYLRGIRKVSDNQVEQQRSALDTFRQEAYAAHAGLARLQSELGTS